LIAVVRTSPLVIVPPIVAVCAYDSTGTESTT
jgi:hypothetical protein